MLAETIMWAKIVLQWIKNINGQELKVKIYLITNFYSSIIELPGYVLECDDVLCKHVEHTKMIDKFYESFVFAWY